MLLQLNIKIIFVHSSNVISIFTVVSYNIQHLFKNMYKMKVA